MAVRVNFVALPPPLEIAPSTHCSFTGALGYPRFHLEPRHLVGAPDSRSRECLVSAFRPPRGKSSWLDSCGKIFTRCGVKDFSTSFPNISLIKKSVIDRFYSHKDSLKDSF